MADEKQSYSKKLGNFLRGTVNTGIGMGSSIVGGFIDAAEKGADYVETNAGDIATGVKDGAVAAYDSVKGLLPNKEDKPETVQASAQKPEEKKDENPQSQSGNLHNADSGL
jgi:hypothetical protein